MISGVFADMEAPGDESGNYYELAQFAVCQIHNVFLTGIFFMTKWPKSYTLINEHNFRVTIHVFHHLARVMFRAHIMHR